jgi:hypothetical protein
MENGLTFNIIDALAVVTCPDCGERYAVAESLWMAVREHQRALSCPAGHAWTPSPVDADSKLSQRVLELGTKLADTRAKLDVARLRLLEAAPAENPSLGNGELLRRCRILAGRAEVARGGEPGRDEATCLFCGARKYRRSLPQHLRRRHADAVKAKPAAYFEAMADRILARFE